MYINLHSFLSPSFYASCERFRYLVCSKITAVKSLTVSNCEIIHISKSERAAIFWKIIKVSSHLIILTDFQILGMSNFINILFHVPQFMDQIGSEN